MVLLKTNSFVLLTPRLQTQVHLAQTGNTLTAIDRKTFNSNSSTDNSTFLRDIEVHAFLHNKASQRCCTAHLPVGFKGDGRQKNQKRIDSVSKKLINRVQKIELGLRTPSLRIIGETSVREQRKTSRCDQSNKKIKS